MLTSVRLRAALLSAALLAVALLVWQGLTAGPAATAKGPTSEYDALMAGATETARVPPPGDVLRLACLDGGHKHVKLADEPRGRWNTGQ